MIASVSSPWTLIAQHCLLPASLTQSLPISRQQLFPIKSDRNLQWKFCSIVGTVRAPFEAHGSRLFKLRGRSRFPYVETKAVNLVMAGRMNHDQVRDGVAPPIDSPPDMVNMLSGFLRHALTTDTTKALLVDP